MGSLLSLCLWAREILQEKIDWDEVSKGQALKSLCAENIEIDDDFSHYAG